MTAPHDPDADPGTPLAEESIDTDWDWTREDLSWVPSEIDTTRPSPSRMYDYALGGKDNFAVDRHAVHRVSAVLPDYRGLALANRGFLVRAVRTMAESGIDQFLDLGTGIPTAPNVHEVAREIVPDARVVYVDNDPIVAAHNRALRAVVDGVATVQRDIRQPDTVLSDRTVREHVDLSRPVGVLFVAVLHFVGRGVAPEIVGRFRSDMASGSAVAISTACSDGMDPITLRQVEAVYEGASSKIVFRSASQVQQLFEGFDLTEPGITDVTQWRSEGTPGPVRVAAGLGWLP